VDDGTKSSSRCSTSSRADSARTSLACRQPGLEKIHGIPGNYGGRGASLDEPGGGRIRVETGCRGRKEAERGGAGRGGGGEEVACSVCGEEEEGEGV
jgi:hypothetical protein